MTRHTLLPLLAAIALAGAAAPANAAKPPPTGTWAGTATYVSPEDSGAPGVEYRSAILISTDRHKGAVRISSMYATVRLYCLEGIRDIRLLESRKGAKGPKVAKNGAFSFGAKGVTVTGILGSKDASGSITASAQGCVLKDATWTAEKRRF